MFVALMSFMWFLYVHEAGKAYGPLGALVVALGWPLIGYAGVLLNNLAVRYGIASRKERITCRHIWTCTILGPPMMAVGIGVWIRNALRRFAANLASA